MVINQDVTEREKLQFQLNQAQKMESVGRLAGGVAHDFNNKLFIINGYAEMAMDMIDSSDPLHENLREIHTAGKKSADIVRQLLAFARKQTISPVLLDLNDTISSMLKMLQRLIGENIDLTWHPGKNLWAVKIDPSQVDQIMANLAVNARDAISDVGNLAIETKNTVIDKDYCRANPEASPGRYVMLAVSDDGCGMEKEVQDFLFEPFFTTKEIGKGTGLGLPTIYGIVKQNNGFLSVHSKPGEGATFKIYLPSHEAEQFFIRFAKESSREVPMGSATVLLVEDEQAILKMGMEMIRRLGYTVLTAQSPKDALRVAGEYNDKIDLLITDVVMPEMNGRDLSSRLRKNHPDLKTLYMSGYPANVIAGHGVLDEGVEFIQKPFSVKDIAVKVHGAIGD
ncbi:nitrogen-specific signal transduction histidine kinase/CheY-like chemotaxis protein [Desulfosalsimonas propionicica]|uniref:histidine kinase n=1 Tax=Desulfosalsimonas propionicica TaxID=332175 RepID=A0A7W0CBE0_9BACT|nr:nitrogen-specific signal transduction histidine kinase/CheY-like chemotaxis protein [Desulfosalsimonas propionicica]